MTSMSLIQTIKSSRPRGVNENAKNVSLTRILNKAGHVCACYARGADIRGNGYAIEAKLDLVERNHVLPKLKQQLSDLNSSTSLDTTVLTVIYGDAKRSLLNELVGCCSGVIVLGDVIEDVGSTSCNISKNLGWLL